jgi:prepilin-type N-terminal cleavage/methylation domain-containing protein
MNKILQKKKASGFTIIEVIIVLAIAGLIMVVVFIAVPQLQRNQRNSAREAVVNRVATEVNNYAGNNTGNIPTANNNATTGFTGLTGGFYLRYIANSAAQFNDPSTGAIMLFTGDTIANVNTAMGAAATPFSTVYYAVGAVCQGETLVAGQPRNFAVANRLEGGSVHCVDNS